MTYELLFSRAFDETPAAFDEAAVALIILIMEVHTCPACGLQPGIDEMGCGWLHVGVPSHSHQYHCISWAPQLQQRVFLFHKLRDLLGGQETLKTRCPITVIKFKDLKTYLVYYIEGTWKELTLNSYWKQIMLKMLPPNLIWANDCFVLNLYYIKKY